MITGVEDVLSRIDDVRQCGPRQWIGKCPAHDDHNPSLSIGEGDDGRLLIHCYAGCAFPKILTALDRETPLATERPKTAKAKRETRSIVATYDYQYPDGKLLFQKVRFEPKSFGIRRPDGRGGWIWGLGDIQPVLYRLPQLIAAETAWQPVYICEGEKDCDRLAELGLVATCNFDGAAAGQRSKWRPEYNEYLAGRVVYILADNDDAGRAHAESIAMNLHGIAQARRAIP